MKLLVTLAALGLCAGSLAYPPARRQPPAHGPAAPDSTAVRLRSGTENPELSELLGRVLNIEKYRLELRDRRLAGRYLRLTMQEYRGGVAGPEKELTYDRSLTQLDSVGRFSLTVYARATPEGNVENMFILPRAGVQKSFKPMPGQANRYSLRFDIHPFHRAADQAGATPTSPAKAFKLPLGSPAILAVYTLPYEKDGMFFYCNLAQSRVPVAEWYRRFKVPHYVVYRARFE